MLKLFKALPLLLAILLALTSAAPARDWQEATGTSGVPLYENGTTSFTLWTKAKADQTMVSATLGAAAWRWGDHAGKYSPLTLKTTLDGLNGLVTSNGEGGYSATPASSFAPAGHDHAGVYLPLAAQAADSAKLSGQDASYYSPATHAHAGIYESAIVAGTTAQYLRGNKTWGTLDQAAVAGLGAGDTVTHANVNATGELRTGGAKRIDQDGNATLASATLTDGAASAVLNKAWMDKVAPSLAYYSALDNCPDGALTGWSNIGTASFVVTSAKSVLGRKAFGDQTWSSGEICLYTAGSAKADAAMQISQVVQSGPNMGLVLRASDDGQNGYFVLPNFTNGNTYFFKRVAGAYTELAIVPTNLTFANGDIVHIRAETIGTTIHWKTWKATDLEPTTWKTWTDSAISASGRCGIYAGGSASGELYSTCDDIYIGDPGATFLYSYSQPTINGQPCLILTPRNYREGHPINVVMYHHGSSELAASLVTEWRKSKLIRRLLVDGYMLCASDAHGNNWGNQAAVEDYNALYRYLDANYTVGKVVNLGQSMGGLTSLLTLTNGAWPKLVGWIGIYPVCSLRAIYDLGTLAPAIRTAYGIAADGSDYAAKTAGHDPALLLASAYDYHRLVSWASSGDTLVPKSTNTDALATLVSGHASMMAVYAVTGDHGDPSHFVPDKVGWFVASY
jgi:hypothetical protein